jgi:hypothetical protein
MMDEQVAEQPQYMVSIYQPEESGGPLIFSFVPKVHGRERGSNGAPGRVPQYIVGVDTEPGAPDLDWSRSPDRPDDSAREQIEAEVAARMSDRASWIGRVNSLVHEVERWAAEMGWSTRRVEKKLDDVRIGKHRVPALLMQQDTFRVLLEPVGRSTPGAEGVVDLYLMPAYDDIASLYFYEDRWNLHYIFPGTTGVATVREARAMPLSKESLEMVLAEMRRDAA